MSAEKKVSLLSHLSSLFSILSHFTYLRLKAAGRPASAVKGGIDGIRWILGLDVIFIVLKIHFSLLASPLSLASLSLATETQI